MGGTLDWRSGLLSSSNEPDWKSGIVKPASTPPQSTQPVQSPQSDEGVKPFPQPVQTFLEKANTILNYPISIGKEAGQMGKEAYAMLSSPSMTPTPENIEKGTKEHPIGSGIASGLSETIVGAAADFKNWPFFASGAARPLLQKLIGTGFAGMMTKGVIDQSGELGRNWDSLPANQKAEGITQMTAGAVMAGLSGSHVIMGDKVHLTSSEHELALDMVQSHLSESMKVGDMEGVKEAISGLQVLIPDKGILHNLSIIADKLEKLKGDENAGTPTEPTEANLHAREGLDTSGQVHPTSPETGTPVEAPQPGEENLRDNSLTTGGGGSTEVPPGVSPDNQGNEGSPTEGGASNVGELVSLLPDYIKAIGGVEERVPVSASTGAQAAETQEPFSTLLPEPVISQAVDRELANNGVTVVEKGKDMRGVTRFLLGLQEYARQADLEGHPLGPLLKSATGYMSDVTKAILRGQADTMKDWVVNGKKLISRDEWSGPLVNLMEDSNARLHYDAGTQMPGVPDNVWETYKVARRLDDTARIQLRDAKRAELQAKGFGPDKIREYIPDNWGLDDHYHHSFPGSWAISRAAGTDAKGNTIWEAIADPNDTSISWRAESQSAAKKMAERFLQGKTDERIRIQQDSVTLPGKSISDKNRLIQLNEAVKDATSLVVNGGDPEEILRQLYDESSAKAFGPRPIAGRSFAPTLQRESNIPGWARDRDSWEDYLMSVQRNIQLIPARQFLIEARNKIAVQGGFPEIQKISDMPHTTEYKGENRQYGNILARMDSAIEGIEGRPGFSDAYMRGVLSDRGLDPNLMNDIGRPFQTMTALLKLGFNPARILSHGMQTLWAVYPVLGEKYTPLGIAHSYDPTYKWLVDDLAISHGVSATDIEGLHSYMGNYFGKGATALDYTKGTASIIREAGMLPFTTGIDFTRRTAAIGAFIQATDRGMPRNQARDFARDVMDRTTGNYSAADNSVLLRQLPGPVSQFKNFALKTGQFIFGLNGWEIPRFLTAIGILGFSSFPFLRAISNLVKNTTNNEVDIDNKLKTAFPKASRGVFGQLGMDVPTGVGLGDLNITRENTPLGGLAGPAASDAYSVAIAAFRRYMGGPSLKAEKELEKSLRDISPEARRLIDEGQRLSSHNSKLIDPLTNSTLIEKLSPKERLELFSGLTPLRVARERDIHENIRNEVAKYGDTRAYFVDKLASIQLDLSNPNLSSADHAEALRQSVMYQREAEQYKVSNNLVKSVIERAKNLQRERLTRDIKASPKPLREGIYQQGQELKGEK